MVMAVTGGVSFLLGRYLLDVGTDIVIAYGRCDGRSGLRDGIPTGIN